MPSRLLLLGLKEHGAEEKIVVDRDVEGRPPTGRQAALPLHGHLPVEFSRNYAHAARDAKNKIHERKEVGVFIHVFYLFFFIFIN